MAEPFRMPILGDGPKGQAFVWEPTPRDRQRAQSNHGQSLERLRERGGLCWSELACVLLDKPWGTTLGDGSPFYARRCCEDALLMSGRTSPAPKET